MGRAYALSAGENARVADAVRDHYAPVGADGELARDDVSRIVGLADRFDTLVGGFAVGLQPTGTADPFALRRACIGILRILIEDAASFEKLRFGDIATFAHGLFAGKKLDLDAAATTAALETFGSERLRGLIETRTSKSAAAAVMAGFAWIDGARTSPIQVPAFALAKARALQRTLDEKAPWLEKAKTVAKRLSGISKEAKPELVARASFTKPTDAAIVDVVEELDTKTRALTTEHVTSEALFTMGELAEQVDRIFNETLVNDPDDTKTPDRLRLLSYGASCMLRIGDFTKIA
jgi:glycyl-tRNA synthetase beta chain